MLRDAGIITSALELLLVSQNLVRIGDLATNIAEDVVFLVEGRSIKHHAKESTDAGAAAGSAGQGEEAGP
jgi:phosphate transport system protein